MLLARSRIEEVGATGSRTVGELIERVYGVGSKIGNGWTRRRVQSIWNKELACIPFHQMCELRDAVELSKQVEDKRALSRAAHMEFIKRSVTFNNSKG